MIYIQLQAPSETDRLALEALVLEHGKIIQSIDVGSQVALVVSAEQPQPLLSQLSSKRCVRIAVEIKTPYILSARQASSRRSRVHLGPGLSVGGREFVVMAGPCSVESLEQTRTIANAVQKSGARVLRGGAFKPRTSPFSFQGLGQEALEILRQVRKETGLLVISELLDPKDLEAMDSAVDVLQIGMRNAQNYALLKALGQLPSHRPVLLKCGIGSRIDEFLCAADYILSEGNPNVMLCLRGTIGFSHESRATMNIADIAALRARTHLPIIVDPSHVAGAWELVPSISASALVAGADGLLVEVHHCPEKALSDGRQSLRPEHFERMMQRLCVLGSAMGRTLPAVERSAASASGSAFEDLCLESPPEGPELVSLGGGKVMRWGVA